MAAVRTDEASPYAPALHVEVHVDTVNAVAAPYVPHAQSPEHVATVRPPELP